MTTIVPDKNKLGDVNGGNYAHFEPDGTMVAKGDATCWKDINLGSAQLSLPAAANPSVDEFKDSEGADTGIETLAFGVDELISGAFELQHDYLEGSDVNFHLHFQGITAPSGTDKVKFQIIYTIASNNAVIPVVTTQVAECDFDTQYEMLIASFPTIDGTSLKIGQQVLFQLSRIAASADEYAGDALLTTVGMHYEVNTLGSRSKTTKA